ncbi:hypothetical protein ZWY2020_006340 [Hordeum vulgare]|nr:hypothetical protein ZWY2020_006340 [Hordeum vulgare]
MALFDEMISDGISPDDITYGSLVMCFCRKNMAEEALQLLNRTLALGFQVKVATFVMVIQALCRDGKAEAAADILRVMLSETKNTSNSFYLSIVRRVAKSGRIEEAERLLQELVDCKCLGKQRCSYETERTDGFL